MRAKQTRGLCSSGRAYKAGEPVGRRLGRGSSGVQYRCSVDVPTAAWADTFEYPMAAVPDLVFPHHENEIARAEAAT